MRHYSFTAHCAKSVVVSHLRKNEGLRGYQTWRYVTISFSTVSGQVVVALRPEDVPHARPLKTLEPRTAGGRNCWPRRG